MKPITIFRKYRFSSTENLRSNVSSVGIRYIVLV